MSRSSLFKIVLGLGMRIIVPITPAQAAAMTISKPASAAAAASIRSLVRMSGLRLKSRRTGHVVGRITKLSVTTSPSAICDAADSVAIQKTRS
jgi:hypothetical protein